MTLRNVFMAIKMNTLIQSGTILTMHNRKVIRQGAIAIEDKTIVDVGKTSHNPISNLKLASGISPVSKMLKKGITVALGTDSPCSNNTAHMFEVMKTVAILYKGITKNPTITPAEKVLEMATIEGAKALSWDNEIGSIELVKKQIQQSST